MEYLLMDKQINPSNIFYLNKERYEFELIDKASSLAGYQVFTGSDTDYEIDFIAFKNEATIYLQVAYLLESDKTIAREFGAFKNIKDHFTKYVVSMDDITLINPEGIRHENIWDFLYSLLKPD